MDEVERIIEEIKRVAKLRFSIMLEPDDEEEEIPPGSPSRSTPKTPSSGNTRISSSAILTCMILWRGLRKNRLEALIDFLSFEVKISNIKL